MTNAIFFDLDDTLLNDARSVETALRKTCAFAESKARVEANSLYEAIRLKAPEVYARYDAYPFTKKIGINPFEGLWGEFDDPSDGFRELKSIITHYQKTSWTEALQYCGINDEQLGRQLATTFRTERLANPFLFDDALPVLEELKESYELVLLTNGSPQLQNIKLKLTPELVPYFSTIIISGEFGIGKPDPSIFEHALSLAGQKAQDVLMVGDNLMTDIKGANATGITSVWLNREGKQPKVVRPDHEIASLDELKKLLPC
ncbi:HAD family hydrolase [Salisediminibacterium selenitireducens]|uniref:Phosphoserine phosphatase n=1 Tax=Bacillus selenitireducens (strain ATCC 700615 / DSM 15326 / MLS10) TaxID=439292 RepID=D6XSD7_BACIE|nr:HAD family hydrolase [Salisediminibacterium selenitireducens]ADH98723.1 HAD-superfamily hydrolase, subfamily IA, variant 1 [[Bacillus] selenitireducens MLS10]